MKALALVEFIFCIQATNSDPVTWESSFQTTEAILHPNFLSRAPPTVIPLVYSALNVESSLAFPVLTSLPPCYVFSWIGFSDISDTCLLLSFLYSPDLVQALWVRCDAHFTSSSCYLVSSNNLYIPLPFKFQSPVGSHLFPSWSLHGFPPVVPVSVRSPESLHIPPIQSSFSVICPQPTLRLSPPDFLVCPLDPEVWAQRLLCAPTPGPLFQCPPLGKPSLPMATGLSPKATLPKKPSWFSACLLLVVITSLLNVHNI